MAQKVDPVEPGSDEAEEVRRDFEERVNMSPAEIEEWLDTEESKSVGQPGGAGGETVGRDSAKRIVAIRRKKVADLTGEDLGHMKKVNGYVARHLKQRPSGDVADTDWARSLKNWGHDPTK